MPTDSFFMPDSVGLGGGAGGGLGSDLLHILLSVPTLSLGVASAFLPIAELFPITPGSCHLGIPLSAVSFPPPVDFSFPLCPGSHSSVPPCSFQNVFFK